MQCYNIESKIEAIVSSVFSQQQDNCRRDMLVTLCFIDEETIVVISLFVNLVVFKIVGS